MGFSLYYVDCNAWQLCCMGKRADKVSRDGRQVLLSRYTREEDIVVGTEHANRRQAELEGVVGCIANPLALRTDLSGLPHSAPMDWPMQGVVQLYRTASLA